LISRRSNLRLVFTLETLAEITLYLLLFCLPLFRGAVYPVERVLFSMGFVLSFVLLELSLFFRNGKFLSTVNFKDVHKISPILLLLGICLHTTVVSARVEESLIRVLDFTALALVFYLVQELFLDKTRRLRFLKLLGGMAFFYTILGWAHGLDWLSHPWWETENLLSGPFVNHNHFAGFLELMLFGILGMVLAQRSKYLPQLLFFWLILFGLFLVTLSRGGWISFFLTLFILGLVLYREKELRALGLKILAGMVVTLVGFGLFLSLELNPNLSERAASLFHEKGQFEFIDFRVKLWQSTLDAIVEKPLQGYGLGSFAWEMRPFRRKGFEYAFDYAHNDWLQYIMELGLGLFLVFLLYLLKILSDAYLRFRSTRLHAYRFEELGMGMGILCLLIHSLVDFNLHIFGNTVIFVSFLGMLSIREDGHSARRSQKPE
jgi:O-antigen ligase